jgi:hypothetical protein
MSKVVEFFGVSTHGREATAERLRTLIESQACPYRNSRCIKTRKSAPDVAIGTCVVTHSDKVVIICPHRMLERRKVFSMVEWTMLPTVMAMLVMCLRR